MSEKGFILDIKSLNTFCKYDTFMVRGESNKVVKNDLHEFIQS